MSDPMQAVYERIKSDAQRQAEQDIRRIRCAVSELWIATPSDLIARGPTEALDVVWSALGALIEPLAAQHESQAIGRLMQGLYALSTDAAGEATPQDEGR